MRLSLVLGAVGLVGCGRIGFDPTSAVDAPPIDVAPDMPVGPPVCPADTVRITTGATVCIDINERGYENWNVARSMCITAGRRLCADAEWFTACTQANGVVGMVGADYEWVAEEAGGIASKRGVSACMDMATHVVTDPYEFRCCMDL